ncbi:WD40 domain-containing protein [Anabaena azotica]|uniref:Novel STAND NTPase 1 domain-containing protein n=1 Tax=Anabaena azotica FACHB-119 TaxID=947527 RepID=A0ABR8D468_9NOST|nr:hypothetical protein [Anabaena azotica]MBD2501702.1 hypothetical protein [Anabaena azotica FACHB-119]
MTNQPNAHHLMPENEKSLQTLLRAITLSQGEFSLIFLRCNYAALRKSITQRLHQLCPVKIHEITLDESVITVYTNIHEQLGYKHPPALIVFGLESAKDIDTALIAANRVREEFRKNFPFPVILWVNDKVIQKFIRLATDLENWATTIHFESSNHELMSFIQKKTDAIFLGDTIPNSQICWELDRAIQDLQSRGTDLNQRLQANLEFVRGVHNYLQDNVDIALVHYQNSLKYWQINNNIKKQGILLFNIGSAYVRQAQKNQVDNQEYYQQARRYLQQCIAILEQGRFDSLVAKYINRLGEVLRQLNAWSDLKNLAIKALKLHRTHHNLPQLAQAYGFLAEVALENAQYDEAKLLAQKALQRLKNISQQKIHERSLYLFILARSQQQLKEMTNAITNLEIAKNETHASYNPQHYIDILEMLRNLYFEQGRYLAAFHIKQEQLQIEQQYGFRAFVGASYLNPQRQVINPLQQVDYKGTIAQEITASGREIDVQRLRERISSTEHKLTVIHGQSGVGKSSILQAGLIPALQEKPIGERDALPILLRVYTDWVGTLGQNLTQAFEEVRGYKLSVNLDSAVAIREQLQRNSEHNLLTVLIFDQFEEFFFVYTDKYQRKYFYEFLHFCLDIPYIKIVLSLREDYLHYLLELERLFNLGAINNNILDKNIRYYLGNLLPTDAKAIIKNLTEKTHFYLEPTLIDKLVEDLASQLGEVRPIELQIVGAQLQTEKINTLQQYCQFGTKDKLVERFLETVLQNCGQENERMARLVLYLLTDENGTRPLKTRTDLASDLTPEAETLDLILEIFVKSGLVLLLPEVPADRYQLVHDYLVPFIRQQQGNELLAELEQERQQRKQIEKELKLVETILVQVNTELDKQQVALKEAQEGTRLEQEGVSALRQFEFTQLESLISAMHSGKALQALVKDGRPLVKYPATSPLLALQTILDNIQERNQFQGHQGWIRTVSFSPDGQYILTASDDCTARLWNLKGKQLVKLQGHEDTIWCASLSQDGRYIATASSDQTARLWNWQGQQLSIITGHQGCVRSVCFSPDGQYIVTAGDDRTARLWNFSGQQLAQFLGHQATVWKVSFSPDGKYIATAGDERIVRLWNIKGKLLERFSGHQDCVWDVAFSPDGEYIATASSDGTARLWNLGGEQLTRFRGHQDVVWAVSFSPDGKYIATASSDRTARLWNLNGQQLAQFSGHQDYVRSVSFSPDGKYIATASSDRTVRLWQVDKRQFLKFSGHQSTVRSVAFSPNGQQIVTASDDRTVRLWNIQGEEIRQFLGHRGKVWTVSLSKDGKYIATASSDRTVRLWDMTGQLLGQFPGHQGTVCHLSFSPDSQYIATASSDRTARLWQLDGEELRQFQGHDKWVRYVSFSGNGKYLVTAADDCTARLWNLQGEQLGQFLGHQSSVCSANFSPDGQYIITASEDHTAKLWSLDGQLLTEFRGHQAPVSCAVFSHDGQYIATSSDDRTARLWNLNGQQLAQFKGHKGAVRCISMSPDAQYIATAADDRTVRLWPIENLDQLLRRGCNWLQDYLENNPHVHESDRRLCNIVKC